MDLFDYMRASTQEQESPLASRMRPTTLDEVVAALKRIHAMAEENPEHMHELPVKTVIRRPDEVKAARTPVICYHFDK